jgi:hypothetical protein
MVDGRAGRLNVKIKGSGIDEVNIAGDARCVLEARNDRWSSMVRVANECYVAGSSAHLYVRLRKSDTIDETSPSWGLINHVVADVYSAQFWIAFYINAEATILIKGVVLDLHVSSDTLQNQSATVIAGIDVISNRDVFDMVSVTTGVRHRHDHAGTLPGIFEDIAFDQDITDDALNRSATSPSTAKAARIFITIRAP